MWLDVDGVGRIRNIHVLTVRLDPVLRGCWAARRSRAGCGNRLVVRVLLFSLIPGTVEASTETVDFLLGDHLPVARDLPVLVLLGLKGKGKVSQAGCIDR